MFTLGQFLPGSRVKPGEEPVIIPWYYLGITWVLPGSYLGLTWVNHSVNRNSCSTWITGSKQCIATTLLRHLLRNRCRTCRSRSRLWCFVTDKIVTGHRHVMFVCVTTFGSWVMRLLLCRILKISTRFDVCCERNSSVNAKQINSDPVSDLG